MNEQSRAVNASRPPPQALAQLIHGHWVSRLIYVAAELGVADLLKDGPKSADDLATSTGAHPRALRRVLRALASVGVFAAEGDRFALTPTAELLQSGDPSSMRDFARIEGNDWHWRTWGDILHSVKTGEPAFEHLFGMECSDYLKEHPESRVTLDEAMGSATAVDAAVIAASYDFSGFQRLVDVGGGQGILLAAILHAHRHVQGVLFDQPAVIAGARGAPRFQAEAIAGRFELISGNFFESLPEGADGYLLKSVLHDWEDERALAILESCRRAMACCGRIVVAEMVIPTGEPTHFVNLLDIQRMVVSRGGERTAAEYRRLFERAGFRLSRILPTAARVSLLEGIPG
jgi:O-methyltransferase domain/Dimerisation domain